MDLRFPYYYGNESEQFVFYQVPKLLFSDSRFENIPIDAKVLYGLMLDRMGLSVKKRLAGREQPHLFLFSGRAGYGGSPLQERESHQAVR